MTVINEKVMNHAVTTSNGVEMFLKNLTKKNPHEPEFLQAAHDVANSIVPFIESNPKYKKFKILERIGCNCLSLDSGKR